MNNAQITCLFGRCVRRPIRFTFVSPRRIVLWLLKKTFNSTRWHRSTDSFSNTLFLFTRARTFENFSAFKRDPEVSPGTDPCPDHGGGLSETFLTPKTVWPYATSGASVFAFTNPGLWPINPLQGPIETLNPYSFNVINPFLLFSGILFLSVRIFGTHSDKCHSNLCTRIDDKLWEQEQNILNFVAFKSLCLTHSCYSN